MRWIITKRSWIVIATIVLAVGMTKQYISHVGAHKPEFQQKIQRNIVSIDKLKQSFELLRNTAFMHIANVGSDKMDEQKAFVEKLIKDVDENFASYAKLTIDEKDRQLLDNDRKVFYPFASILFEVLELSRENEQKDNALKLATTELKAASNNVAAALSKHVEYNRDQAWYESQRVNERTSNRWRPF